jgi:class 3 adenylate cyclase/tetratricopeptide (TPR) repeat protein/ABC-type transport system involved in cytochrome c biogenesis ATPase subunit
LRDIVDWLDELGLAKHGPLFAEAEIDFDTLAELIEADLKELGLPLGPRRKIWNAIQRLDGHPSAGPAHVEVGPPVTPTALASDAERRHLTVMFVDLVGSTEMATKMDAEDMRDVITSYQNTVAGVVTRYEGFVAKFMGDGVLCYFGWPRANEDDAERAVRAGLSIIEAVKTTTAPNGSTLSTRVGVATGVVIVGDLIGSGATQEAAVVGETPNLAARLQGNAGLNQLVVAKETHRLLGTIFDVSSLGGQDLKGIASPVEAYRIDGETSFQSRFAARQSGDLTPIIGRRREIDLITERWTLARSSKGQMVIISGEAGIGKSRITQAVIDEIASDDHIRLTYQCSPYHADSAFYPVTQQLSFIAKFAPSDSADTRLDKLEALLGDDRDMLRLFATLLGLDGTERYGRSDLTPPQQRTQTMHALAEMLLRQAAEKPVLMVFEDLHWIDPTSRELLDTLLEQIADQPIMILSTARPSFEYDFGGHPIVTKFALNRLGKPEIGAVVSKLTRGKALPGEIMDIIARRTDGVPLFVEELTKTILEADALKENTERYVLDGPLSAIAIPTTLHDSLMARLDRMQAVKEIAQFAACIGREFDHDLLAEISAMSDTELSTAMDKLIKAELIYRQGLPPHATYTFKHALVRDAAYESLLKGRRKDVHARIFLALKENADTAPALLALHAECADRDDDASRCWRQAGLHSAGNSAAKEAVGQFERAIKALGRLPANREQALTELTIRTEMAGPLVSVVGYASEKMEDNFRYALKLSEQTGEIARIFPILYGRFIFHLVSAQIPKGVELAEEILELAKSQEHPEPMMLGHRVLGMSKLFSGDLSAALTHLRTAAEADLSEIDRSAPYLYGQDLETAARVFISLALSHTGYPDQALDAAKSSFKRGEWLNHPHTLAYALAISSYGFSDWRRIDQLSSCLLALKMVIQEDPEMQLWPIMLHYLEFRCLALTGHPDQALTHVESYVTGMTSARFMVLLPGVIAEKAEVLIELGDADAAKQAADEAFELAESTGELWQVSKILAAKGRIQRMQGNDVGARETFQKGLKLAHRHQYAHSELRLTLLYASLLQDCGEPEEARKLIEAILDRFTEGSDLPDLIEAQALLTQLQV